MPDQRILFSKSGTAKYISHLDLMHTMERAFLRAGITIRHTAGFHPHPYVSIPLPLPLGFSSQCELMEFGLEEGCTMEELPQKMNQVLPAGIVIHDCYEGGLPFRALSFVRYDIFLEFDGNLAQAAGEAFQELVSRDHFIVQKRSKKSKRGFTEVDLIPLIEGVETVQAQGDTLSYTASASPKPWVKPQCPSPRVSDGLPFLCPRVFFLPPARNFGPGEKRVSLKCFYAYQKASFPETGTLAFFQ